MQLIGVLTVVIFCLARMAQSVHWDIDLQLIKCNTSAQYGDFSNLRVMKYNRTLAVLNGTFVVAIDIDNKYEFGISAAYSRLGNQQFNESPIKIPRAAFCPSITKFFKDYGHVFEKSTNLPLPVTTDELCPFPKGNYWVRHLTIPPEVVPVFLQNGYWKTSAEIFEIGKQKSIANMDLFARLTKQIS